MSDAFINSQLEQITLASKIGVPAPLSTSVRVEKIPKPYDFKADDPKWEIDPYLNTDYTPEDHRYFDSLGEV